MAIGIGSRMLLSAQSSGFLFDCLTSQNNGYEQLSSSPIVVKKEYNRWQPFVNNKGKWAGELNWYVRMNRVARIVGEIQLKLCKPCLQPLAFLDL